MEEEIQKESTIETSQKDDTGNIFEHPIKRRLAYNIFAARLSYELDVRPQEFINRGLVESQDEGFFLFCCANIVLVKNDPEGISDITFSALRIIKPFDDVLTQEDCEKITMDCEETFEGLRESWEREKSSVLLSYFIRLAYDYINGRASKDLIDNRRQARVCVDMIHSCKGHITPEILKERLGEDFPLLRDHDYKGVFEGYIGYIEENKYRYGESNPGLQDENLLS
jgi:hypothetical protein